MTYDWATTAEEVAEECRPQIANKTLLVTGASAGGLGAAFAVIIAKYNPACLILATRNVAKAEETAREIAAVAPSVRTHCIALDLGSLAQIREAAKKINELDENIDILVNNAGVMAIPYAKTVDGFEQQLATNHLGHFLLTNLLLPKMLARDVPVRVVNVASNGYRFSSFRFEDWNFDDGKTYNRWISYAQSKTANLLFSVSLAQKLGKQNLVSVSLHPGVIQTQLGRDLEYHEYAEITELDRAQGHRRLWGQMQYKTQSQGVATHVFAAFHPSLDSPDANGRYLTNSHVLTPEHVHSWGRDLVEAERLWSLTEELVAQKFEY